MTDEKGHRSTVHRPPRRLIEEREDALSLRRSFAMKNKVNRKRSRVHSKRPLVAWKSNASRGKVIRQRSTVLGVKQMSEKLRFMEV